MSRPVADATPLAGSKEWVQRSRQRLERLLQRVREATSSPEPKLRTTESKTQESKRPPSTPPELHDGPRNDEKESARPGPQFITSILDDIVSGAVSESGSGRGDAVPEASARRYPTRGSQLWLEAHWEDLRSTYLANLTPPSRIVASCVAPDTPSADTAFHKIGVADKWSRIRAIQREANTRAAAEAKVDALVARARRIARVGSLPSSKTPQSRSMPDPMPSGAPEGSASADHPVLGCAPAGRLHPVLGSMAAVAPPSLSGGTVQSVQSERKNSLNQDQPSPPVNAKLMPSAQPSGASVPKPRVAPIPTAASPLDSDPCRLCSGATVAANSSSSASAAVPSATAGSAMGALLRREIESRSLPVGADCVRRLRNTVFSLSTDPRPGDASAEEARPQTASPTPSRDPKVRRRAFPADRERRRPSDPRLFLPSPTVQAAVPRAPSYQQRSRESSHGVIKALEQSERAISRLLARQKSGGAQVGGGGQAANKK